MTITTTWIAKRENRERGHVAIAVVRYSPAEWRLPMSAIALKPWLCVFHDVDGEQRPFVAFGGQEGAHAVVEAELGALV